MKIKDVVKMFDLLIQKGYTIEEILEMPIVVGNK